jgi:glycosyltransferase involved in cell wall biosynthesis
MRIAIIAPLVTPIREPQRGGSQAVVADLAQGLAGRGHEIDVYAATGSAISGVNVIDTGVRSEDLASSLYRYSSQDSLPRLRGRVRVGAAQKAFEHVFELIEPVPYDVVHNHAFDAPAIRCGATISLPMVHTLHLPADPEMATALDDAARSANPPSVATVSEASAAGWRQLTRVDSVLRNGVPVDRIPWSPSGGERLLFAGRLSAEKGAGDAIAIARAAGIPIDIYGDAYDPDYARREIEPHRRDRGVAIHSGIPRVELWAMMAAARAVLCPARWEEPFGMVAAEAQAAGTPVIAYRSGALPEVIVHGKTGFLVPVGDIEEAASAVRAIGSIDRAACRRHAVQTLGLDATITAHERLYQQLSSAAGSPRRA